MSAKDQKKYWKSRIRKRTYSRNGETLESKEYYAFIQWDGVRKWIPLGTGNQDNAAAEAAQVYRRLTSGGWEAVTKKRHSLQNDLSVGQFLAKIETVSKVSPRSWGNYTKALRQIVSEVRGLDSPKGANYSAELHEEWRARVDETSLRILDGSALTEWTKSYVVGRAKGPDAARKAKTSCNTILRNAKALFKVDSLRAAGLSSLENPFSGVRGYPPERQRYRSQFDAQRLLFEAQAKLTKSRDQGESRFSYFRRMEAFKALVLLSFTAIRRKEADLLLWEQVLFEEGLIDIRRTRFFEPKSESAIGRIPIDEEAIEILKGYRENDPTGEFVLRGPRPRKETSHSSYRCDKTFRFLIDWLRKYETDSGLKPFAEVQKPLHEIRKEVGALLATNHGIFAAQRFLRHAEISTTERYYSDQKSRVTAGLSLSSPNSEDS